MKFCSGGVLALVTALGSVNTHPTKPEGCKAPPPGPSSSSSSPYNHVCWGGVNYAGFDFGCSIFGNCSGGFVPPPLTQPSHFTSEGANLFRIPFGWQYMQPALSTPLNETFFDSYDSRVQAALDASQEAYAIIDVHNYARWYGLIIGQNVTVLGAPTNTDFANLWGQLAGKYKDDKRVIFGLMNEPHDLDMTLWAQSCQSAVNAIRAAGAINQYILLPGTSFTSAQAFPTESGPFLEAVTDPAHQDSTEYLLFDVHKYLDIDNSGTHTECVTNNIDIGVGNGTFPNLASYLRTHGRQAMLTETGGGANDTSCVTYLGEELDFLIQNNDVFLGFATWAAGSFDPYTYNLTETPFPNGTDQYLVCEAIAPRFPGA
ncbi:hypothetical protein YB2330_000386 [Saitoella coloradoensis]